MISQGCGFDPRVAVLFPPPPPPRGSYIDGGWKVSGGQMGVGYQAVRAVQIRGPCPAWAVATSVFRFLHVPSLVQRSVSHSPRQDTETLTIVTRPTDPELNAKTDVAEGNA